MNTGHEQNFRNIGFTDLLLVLEFCKLPANMTFSSHIRNDTARSSFFSWLNTDTCHIWCISQMFCHCCLHFCILMYLLHQPSLANGQNHTFYFMALWRYGFTDLLLGGESLFFIIRACHITFWLAPHCAWEINFLANSSLNSVYWGMSFLCFPKTWLSGMYRIQLFVADIKKMEHWAESPLPGMGWHPTETDHVITCPLFPCYCTQIQMQVWKHWCDTFRYWTTLQNCFVVLFHGLWKPWKLVCCLATVSVQVPKDFLRSF